MTFGTPELLAKLPTMTREEVDALNFGVIKVNNAGVIEVFNRYESELVGVPSSKAEGRNFFTQVAPCTNNRLISGRFKDGVSANALDITIPYTFTYKMRPSNVNIHLYRDSASETNWVLVQRR
jgi:photoactive yellow protein